MLLPRYSLRWFFYLFFVVAIFGIVLGQGLQGATWALAVACGVGSLAVTWVVMVAFYAMARLAALLLLPAGVSKGQQAYYPAPAAARPPAGAPEDEDPAGKWQGENAKKGGRK